MKLAAVGLLRVVVIAVFVGTLGMATTAEARASRSSAQLAARLAQKVSNARSLAEKEQAVIEVMRTLRVGVYSGSGHQLLRGGETGPKDLFLYDFEVTELAHSLLRHQTAGFLPIGRVLLAAGAAKNGQPPPDNDLAGLVRDWVASAVHQRATPDRIVPLLIRDLGLRHGVSYDLARHVTVAKLRLDGLQTFLIEAALVGPGLRYASEHSRDSVHSATQHAARVASLCDEEIKKPTLGEKIHEAITDHLTDYLQEKLAARMGEYVVKALEGFGRVSSLVTHVLDAVHAGLLLQGLRVSQSSGPYETAYGPNRYVTSGPTPGMQLRYWVRYEYLDDLNETLVNCFAEAGLKLPRKGGIDGVRVLWNMGSELLHHGSFSPVPLVGPIINSPTDASGTSTVTFTPRDEAIAGLGTPVVAQSSGSGDTTSIAAQGLLGFATGNVVLIATVDTRPQRFFPWKVTYHDQAGSLSFDSTITDYGIGTASGTETYHVHSDALFGAADPAATPASEPLAPTLPYSTPLEWRQDDGQLTQSGSLGCELIDGLPVTDSYRFSETMSPGSPGLLSIDSATSSGTGSPIGLPLAIRLSIYAPSDNATDQISTGSGGCGTPTLLPTSNYWETYFKAGHSDEVADDPSCNTDCFDITGWQGGTSGIYASKTYSLPLTDDSPGCDSSTTDGGGVRTLFLAVGRFPSVTPSCIPTQYSESTTMQIRQPG